MPFPNTVARLNFDGHMLKREKLIPKIQKLKLALKNDFSEYLKKDPSLVLPLRLNLNMSQREFAKLVKISQQSLIKYENEKCSKLTKTTVDKITAVISTNLKVKNQKIVNNFTKFEKMFKGSFDSEKARAAQKIWVKKIPKSKRELWGRKGALITNQKQKLTKQEKKVLKILKSAGFKKIKTHSVVDVGLLKFNIDFVIETQGKKIFIEVTKRRWDLMVLSQALAYRALQLKKKYPNCKLIIMINDKLPLLAREILDKEFDAIFLDSQFNEFRNWLSQGNL